jgi:hypothetical protein
MWISSSGRDQNFIAKDYMEVIIIINIRKESQAKSLTPSKTINQRDRDLPPPGEDSRT